MSTAQTAAPVAASLSGGAANQAAASGGQAASNGAAQADTFMNAADALSRSSDTVFSWGGYFQALAFLFFIVAALFAALWYLKQKGGLGLLTRHGDLVIESRLPMGPKKFLVVVRFLNKKLLLGVTDQRITMLMELPTDEDDPPLNSQRKGTSSDFKDLLTRKVAKNNAET